MQDARLGVLAADSPSFDRGRSGARMDEGSATPQSVSVRVLGSLRPSRVERGLPYEFLHAVPAEGVIARQLAEDFGLPLDRTEGVFVNHTVHGLGVRIMPGDRIAFCSNDTPGPHRFFLGLFDAGKDDDA